MDFSMQFSPESDPAIDNSNKGSNNEEYCRALKPEQEVSYETSDQQEGTYQAKQHPQPTTIKTHQEVSLKSTRHAEVKPDVKEKKNDDTIKVLIPTGGDPVSNDTVIKDNAEDNDKNGASGTNIGNHVKELEHIEKGTGAITKSHSNETKIIRESSFRITSVIDTANTEEEEVESD